jgi:hypothetical protein
MASQHESGKFTEGLTNFALKGGKFHLSVKLDASMPGKTALNPGEKSEML